MQSLLQLPLQGAAGLYSGYAGIPSAGPWKKLLQIFPEYRELKAYGNVPEEDMGRLTLYEDNLLPLGKLYSLETAFEKALGKNVWLKSGGYLVIEPTEAMTVIDVNTRRSTQAGKRCRTPAKINMEATDEMDGRLGCATFPVSSLWILLIWRGRRTGRPFLPI